MNDSDFTTVFKLADGQGVALYDCCHAPCWADMDGELEYPLPGTVFTDAHGQQWSFTEENNLWEKLEYTP